VDRVNASLITGGQSNRKDTMDVLKQAGYTKYKTPQTKNADEFWQKKVDVAASGDMHIEAYVYYPKWAKNETTLEFELYVEKENFASKTKLYSFSNLSGRDLEKIENKAKAIYIAIRHL
jgi:hypothetical protein